MVRVPSGIDLDPIGDFLEVQRRLGCSDETLETVRHRIERFRRAFPGIPLAALHSGHLERHLADLQAHGMLSVECEHARQVCGDFLSFHGSHVPAGSSEARPGEVRGASRWVAPTDLIAVPPVGTAFPPGASASSPGLFRSLVLLTLVALAASLVGGVGYRLVDRWLHPHSGFVEPEDTPEDPSSDGSQPVGWLSTPRPQGTWP